MTPNDTIERLRAANPAPTKHVANDELFAAIVATRGDERLGGRARGRRRRWLGRAALAVAALTLTAGAAWAAIGPLALFSSNPQADGAAPGSLWDQDVVPESVERAGVVEIPRYGTVEFWHADARQGGWCGAIRLPDGRWAATRDGDGEGTVPGCYPTRAQVNDEDPVFALDGFDYYEVQLDARERGGSFWRVYYGLVAGERPVVSVGDRVSGRRATVSDGGRFVLAVPDADPERAAPLPGDARAIDLVAYDVAGRVVAAERP